MILVRKKEKVSAREEAVRHERRLAVLRRRPGGDTVAGRERSLSKIYFLKKREALIMLAAAMSPQCRHIMLAAAATEELRNYNSGAYTRTPVDRTADSVDHSVGRLLAMGGVVMVSLHTNSWTGADGCTCPSPPNKSLGAQLTS